MEQNIRNEDIDFFRGIAAILMILGHSFITYPVDISNVKWCAAIENLIYMFHMELFFLISGLVYKCVNYKKFINKKANRILVPYIFFGVLALFLRSYGGGAVNKVEPMNIGIKKLVFYGGGIGFYMFPSFYL